MSIRRMALPVALLAIGAVVWAARNDAFAFRDVVVATPLARSSPANLEAAIRSDLSGTFFTLDLDAARAALARVPWVRNVSLRRQWPGRLEIAVEEHVPYARWGDSGLVNEQGEIFAATHDGDLPQFDGPDARVSEVTARHREWSALLAPLDLRLRAIAVSPRGGWRLKAGSEEAALAIELGRDEPDARRASTPRRRRRRRGRRSRTRTPRRCAPRRARRSPRSCSR